jgi:uncharacterized protein YjiS (DUF1127 family)
MTNAQNGVTAAGRPSLAMSVMVAGAGHVAARIWCRTTATVAERIVNPTVAWFRLGRDMAELSRLDERALRDVGVNHADFAAIRDGTFERANMLSEERIVFNPDAGREPTRRPDAPDFFRPFGPDARWYLHCWFGD